MSDSVLARESHAPAFRNYQSPQKSSVTMNQFSKFILLFYWSFLLIPFNSLGQQTNADKVNKEHLILAALEIMEASGTCALITLDEASLPMVRMMDPFLPEGDFTVWMGTNAKSRKVSHIQNNQNVTLFYQDEDRSGYVVLHGKAEIIDDDEEKQKWWKPAWEAFYPNNREGYTLIKVSAKSLEILSPPRGILGDSITWKAPVLGLD